jgi:hypothetical protein
LNVGPFPTRFKPEAQQKFATPTKKNRFIVTTIHNPKQRTKIKTSNFTMTSNNIRLCFLFLIFCCNGNILFSTAELTEDIIVAKEEAWARRAIEDYNRVYRLRQHPLAHEIKYELPFSGDNDLDNRVEDEDDDKESDIISSSNDVATQVDDKPMEFYLRGRAAASKTS